MRKKIFTHIQNLGDLEPVTFKFSKFWLSTSTDFNLFFRIQPTKSNNDTINETMSDRNVLVSSHESIASGVTAIPRLR